MLSRRSLWPLLVLLCFARATPAQSLPQQYTVRAGDVLRLRVWPDQDLSGEFQVESSGKVYLPLVGEVAAAGMPLPELQRHLRDLYGGSGGLKNPVISITPLFPVTVFGAVNQPGVYLSEPTHTVMYVIARAGGFTPRARTDAIRIIRDSQTISFNARDALERGEVVSLTLQSGDRLVIPQRSNFSFTAFAQLVQLLGTTTLIILQLTNN